jgi:hypothetical protein
MKSCISNSIISIKLKEVNLKTMKMHHNLSDDNIQRPTSLLFLENTWKDPPPINVSKHIQN